MKILVLLLTLGSAARAADAISPAQAKAYVGKTVTVCGVVASAAYLEKGKDAPTLINLDKAYPKQIFTVVIYGKDRAKFGKPESDLLKKKVCATGTITSFKGVPQIVVADPMQLKPTAKTPAKK